VSGHSKWSKIKRDKGANDAKRGAVFTRLGNQIAVAAKAGADPTMNPNLQMAIDKARASNMPKDNIQRSIDRAADKNAAQLEEVTYEGYGPAGVGIIIETATDNKNRTLPEVKTALIKNGGRIADAGSVMFQFERKGVIQLEETGEDTLLMVLEAGADDAVEEAGEMTVYTEQKELMKVRANLVESGLKVVDAALQYVPTISVDVTDEETSNKIIKIMDALDDLDDVVNVNTNANILTET